MNVFVMLDIQVMEPTALMLTNVQLEMQDFLNKHDFPFENIIFENSKKWSPGTKNIRTSTVVDEVWAEGAFVGDCSIHSICTNTPGSRECECKVGFEGDGLTCQNINECELGTHLCSEFAHCVDINGDYNCQCWIGWSGNGIICENIDECSEVGSHDCHYYADCTDTDGSFECECIDGFYGSGNECLGRVIFVIISSTP